MFKVFLSFFLFSFLILACTSTSTVLQSSEHVILKDAILEGTTTSQNVVTESLTTKGTTTSQNVVTESLTTNVINSPSELRINGDSVVNGAVKANSIVILPDNNMVGTWAYGPFRIEPFELLCYNISSTVGYSNYQLDVHGTHDNQIDKMVWDRHFIGTSHYQGTGRFRQLSEHILASDFLNTLVTHDSENYNVLLTIDSQYAGALWNIYIIIRGMMDHNPIVEQIASSACQSVF